MRFYLDPNKQTQEILLRRKKKLPQTHKHLGMVLDSNLTYGRSIYSILNKLINTIGLLC